MSVIWGIPYLLIKVAVGELTPVLVVFGRCVVGAAILLPWALAQGWVRPALRHWRALLLFTVLEMAGPWLLLSYAETKLSSSLTRLLVATTPFVAALAGRIAGDEDRLTAVRLVGMGLGVVGIVALLGLDVSGAELLPIAAVALTVVGYATGPMVVSRALPEVPGVAASAVALTVTAVVYAPFAVPQLGDAVHASAKALLSVVGLGVVCTALALAVFFLIIREVARQRSLVITFVTPAVAVVLGVALLGEPFTLGIALGLPLVLAGCVLATRRSAPVPEAETVVTPGQRAGRGRREAPLRLGHERAGVCALPRRGVGHDAARRRRAVRADDPGGLPVRPVVDHDPAQARGLPRRVRGVPHREGRPVRSGRRGAAHGRRGHRPQPRQDHRGGQQRAGRAGAAGGARRAAVVVRAGRSAAPPGHPGRRPRDQSRVGRDGQGAETARLRLRRSDHRLRPHAGDRHGRRPRGHVLPRHPLRGLVLDGCGGYGIIDLEHSRRTPFRPRAEGAGGRRRRHAWRP